MVDTAIDTNVRVMLTTTDISVTQIQPNDMAGHGSESETDTYRLTLSVRCVGKTVVSLPQPRCIISSRSLREALMT